MLTQREIKFENMRQEQILRVTKTPNKYVLCEVTNDHCCKVLTTLAKGDKVYCVKMHCQKCDTDAFKACELGFYFHEKPIHSNDPILSVISSMRQSSKLLHTTDNMEICDHWSLVGKNDESINDTKNSAVKVSTIIHGKNIDNIE